MPKLDIVDERIKCEYCNNTARFISVNSKRYRCSEKITQCPGHIQAAKAAREKNISEQDRKAHMKKMSLRGNTKLQKLHEDTEWLEEKSKSISNAAKKRGGHNGKNNPMFGNTHSEETRELMRHRAKERDKKCYQKQIETKIDKGIAIPKELKTDWEIYKEKVCNFTRISWINHNDILNPNNLIRGNEYELDHKFSITEGFNHRVPPEIIGHFVNLELISKNENRSKRTRCSIDIEALYSEYGKYSTIPSDSPSSDTTTS